MARKVGRLRWRERGRLGRLGSEGGSEKMREGGSVGDDEEGERGRLGREAKEEGERE